MVRQFDPRLKSTCALSGLLPALLLATAAYADDTPASDKAPATRPATQLDDITVTARRTAENLIKTPVAVSAINAGQIAARGITNIDQLGDFTPGFRRVNQTFSRNDRGYQTFVMRGIYGGDGAPRQPVRIFVDGTPLVSGDIAGLDAVERVEVVEGPQSAYFGRSTFAGAVNFIMKQPSFTPKASGSVDVSSYSSVEYRAAVEGGLIDDKLSMRVSALFDKNGSPYENYGLNSRLGEQKTKSVSVTLFAHPIDTLTIKAFAQVWSDEDGPPAQGVLHSNHFNCNAGAAAAGTLNYTCGAIGSVPRDTLYYNTQYSSEVIAHLTSQNVVYYLPNNFINYSGLKREANQGFVSGEYTGLGDWVVNANASWLHDEWSNVIDGYQSPNSPNRVISTPQNIRGFSSEGRITSPRILDRFRFVFGANYLFQNILASAPGYVGNPQTVTSAVVFFSNPTQYLSRTYGLFGSLHADVTDRLHVDVEGRYQYDNVMQAIIARPQSSAGSVGVSARTTFPSFTPKAVLSYDFQPSLMGYLSYARGTRPGEFNTSLYALPAANRDALIAQSNARLQLKQEQLDMYEAGLKGEFFDRRLRLVGTAYYGDWRNRHVSAQVGYYAPGSSTLLFVTPITDNSTVQLYGVEGKADLRATRFLSFDGAFAYNESRIRSTYCVVCAALTGNPNPTGTRLPAYPAWTGHLGATYEHPITDRIDGFIRLDYIYTGKQYDSEANLAWTPPAHKINARIGANRGRYGVEVYGTNIFWNKVPSSIFGSYNALEGGYSIVASPPEPRTFGVKFSVKG